MINLILFLFLFFFRAISLFAICVKRSRATDAKQHDVEASLERVFKKKSLFEAVQT